MYTFLESSIGNHVKHTLTNTTTGEFLEIIPDLGANLHKLVLKKGGKSSALINSADDPEGFRAARLAFEGAKLCPWTCRLTRGKYSWEDTSYQLPANDLATGSAIHGLIYNKPFEVQHFKQNGTSGSLEYLYSFMGEEGYPFPFDIRVSFILKDKALECQTEFLNTGSSGIPLGDGWHPYFNLDTRVDDLMLKLPGVEEVVLNESLVPSGHFKDFKGFQEFELIGKREMDTSFRIKTPSGIVESFIFDQKTERTVRIWQETGKKGYQYLIVYIPDSRGLIAVEPMTCSPDVFNSKMGMINLKPNENIKLKMGIELL